MSSKNTKETFRDSIATVDQSGKRKWIYPKKPKGSFYDKRKIVSYLLLIVLFVLPFIKINGEPFILLNVLERHFILFGIPFSPQDFYIFALSMITGMLFIVLFTVVFGRLFCGWVCPQTIFMEMVFRRIEYWIEGDYNAQKRLNAAPWTPEKVRKKVLKQAIFILISVFIAHTFLSYIIGIDEVWKTITSPPSENWGGFIAMIVFTGLFYGVFSVMREQVCIAICPYGRLQGVMLDKNSVAVIYDWVRGEPRGRIKKSRKKAPKPTPKEPCKKTCTNCQEGKACSDDILHKMEESVKKAALETDKPTVVEAGIKLPTSLDEKIDVPLGDCIDCGLCVKVCPTGIDIRNGTQLECVNCTACIDACDEVMVKVGRDPGLIRYDSHNGIEKSERKIFTTRSIVYSVVLALLLIVNGIFLLNRNPTDVLIMRTPGMLYQENTDGSISNLYNYQITNRLREDVPIEFKLVGIDGGKVRTIGKTTIAPGSGQAKGSMFIDIPIEAMQGRSTKVKVEVWSEGKKLTTVKTNFLGYIK